MNEHQTVLDQADEEIPTYDVSDEAMEAAAASPERGVIPLSWAIKTRHCVCK